ncbi:hypothetical protein D3C81_2084030 [compost metagenome]
MQVDTLTSHIRTQQYTQLAFRLAEGFDDGLLLYVAHAAMQYLDGIVLKFEILLQLGLQPVERFDPFTEDH